MLYQDFCGCDVTVFLVGAMCIYICIYNIYILSIAYDEHILICSVNTVFHICMYIIYAVYNLKRTTNNLICSVVVSLQQKYQHILYIYKLII